MRRPLLVFAAMACLATAAHAAAKAAFVERSYVVAPRTAGAYRLVDTAYDPSFKTAGVTLRYASPDRPTVPIDVFVYPAGDMPTGQAVEHGLVELRGSFDVAAKAGYYQDPKTVEDVAFSIAPVDEPEDSEDTAGDSTDEPASDAPGKPRDSKEAGSSEEEELSAEVLRQVVEIAKPKPLDGRRLTLSYRKDAQKLRSRAYLFYKNMYFFKGRVTVPEDVMSAEDFARFSDEAIRALVPALQVAHKGTCGDATIYVDPDKPEAERATALMLDTARVMARSRETNCLGDKELAALRATPGLEIIELQFEADEWGAQ